MTTQQPRKIPVCAPRKSGLTRLQLALMGKGPVARQESARRRPGVER